MRKLLINAVAVLLAIQSVCFAKGIEGAFIQLDATKAAWSQAEWAVELGYMRDMGMDTIIIGASVYETTAYYPTAIAGYTEVGSNPLEKILTEADTHNMDVHIGMRATSLWWQNNTPFALQQMASADIQIATELYTLYGSHTSLKGLYIVEEIYNLSWMAETNRQSLVNNLLKPVSDHIKTLNPNLIVSEAPFFKPTNGTLSQTPAEYEQWWIDTLTDVPNLDLVMPQDGIGAQPGVMTLEVVEQFFGALKAACDATGRTLWSDLEVFDVTDWSTRPLAGIVEQIEAEEPLVEKIVCWEWFYLTPSLSNRTGAYDFSTKYKAWLRGLEPVSGGKSYTVSPAPSASYPDSGGELTDGFAKFEMEGQVGWSGASPLITVDLEQQRKAEYGFMASFMSRASWGIYPPISVQVSVSSDGVNFSSVGSMQRITNYPDKINSFELFGETVHIARYVRFSVQNSGGWLMCCEVEVFRAEPELDLTGNGEINLADVGKFFSYWLNSNCVDPAECSEVDYDGSGVIDFVDYSIYTLYWR